MRFDIAQDRLLRVRDTCWRIERARRMAVIVDAADYFALVRAAIETARHSVLLIGWDFDTRIELDRSGRTTDGPNTLGSFLRWVVRNRPGLRVYILRWDLGVVQSLGRGVTAPVLLEWATGKRIRFKLDGAHPIGAAHHQKIVVVDDALAFCGGIDITGDRWDTRDHLDDNPKRVQPNSRRQYDPWHDVTTAVDGDVARALGDLGRERWRLATGEVIQPPPPTECTWPAGLEPTLRDVDVAISRTIPKTDAERGVREIEALYLTAIAAARRTLYVESQYFASRRLAEAMATRLGEPEGPEIVVVNPQTADGWLEEEVMGSSRARLLELVRRADRYGRFRMYCPVTAGRKAIYVHAKVLVVDDRLLRVGSSNLNNRSLGFDTECDLSVEVRAEDAGAEDLAGAIVALRNDLLGEHLGVGKQAVQQAIDAAGGSLIGAIEALRGDGRSLVPFEPPELNWAEDNVLRENQLLDPERPASRWRELGRFFRRTLHLGK